MSRARTNLLVLLFAILGCVVAILLTVKHFQPDLEMFCGKRGGCQGALGSAYGHLGPVPTSVFGLGLYVVLVGLCLRRKNLLMALGQEERSRASAYSTAGGGEGTDAGTPSLPESPPSSLSADVKRLDGVLWGLALAGFGVSWWLQYVALFQIETFCSWCFTSAMLLTGIFALTTYDHWVVGKQIGGEQKLLLGVLTAIGVLSILVYSPSIYDQFLVIQKKAQLGTPRVLPLKAEEMDIADIHYLGDPKAPVLLIEFGDYMCEACKRSVAILDEFQRTQRKKIRVAFRHKPMPLFSHAWSQEAAEVAEVAGAQGKFWEMHRYLFEHQDAMRNPNFDSAGFDTFAKRVGLDMERFKRDRAAKTYEARVRKDTDLAERAGVTGTPTFFLVRDNQVWKIGGSKQLDALAKDEKSLLWK